MMKKIKIRNMVLGAEKPKICVPIAGENKVEILTEAQQIADSKADVAEWRLDYFKHPVENIELLVEIAAQLRVILVDKPLILTFRTPKEGGKQAISAQDYLLIYQSLMATGSIDIIDLELFFREVQQPLTTLAQQKKIKVLMSYHHFTKTPTMEVLQKYLQEMSSLQADICKIAVMPQTFQDVLALLAVTTEAKEQLDQPVITMSMGSLGALSRFIGELSGSVMTFGSIEKLSAPGQIPIDTLNQLLTLIHQLSEA